MLIFDDQRAFDLLVPGPDNVVEIVLQTYDHDLTPDEIENEKDAIDGEVVYKNRKLVLIKHISTLILPRGSVIHRYDEAGAAPISNAVPAFFGNKTTYAPYGRGRANALSSYSVKKDIILLNLNLDNLLTIAQTLDGEEEDIMALYLRQRDNRFYVLPTLPVEGGSYLNRVIANMICSMGFNGWVVKPLDPAKREGLRQYSILRREIVPYDPEILLCNWRRYLDVIVPGGKRSATKKRRRGRVSLTKKNRRT
jgi:hypothetical protein